MCCCRNHREKNISEEGGGGRGGNVKLKLLGAIYTTARQFCAFVGSFVIP